MFYYYLYNSPSYSRILIGSLLRSITGADTGGGIGWISTPHFSVKKIIRNVTLFEIENK